MAVIRTLVTRLVLDSKAAYQRLKQYDGLWKVVAKSVEVSADRVERASARAMDALQRVNTAAASAKAGAGGVGVGRAAGPAGGRRPAADPLDAAIRGANKVEAERARRVARDEAVRNRGTRASASKAGLEAGSERVKDATRALGAFATASDKAKAKVADLTATVERNRKEMADLRRKVVETGDADGTLAARMRGLQVATGEASIELAGARRELRAVDGGLLDAVRSAGNLRDRFGALTVAAGNLISAAVVKGVDLVGRGLVAAGKGAIDFESAMGDVAKVLSAPDLENFDALNKGVLDLSRNVGVAPEQVAALTASLAQSGIAGDELLKTAEDASKLSVAFGVSGEDAGQALAKLRTGLGLSREQVNSLTGSINELSNGLAATAPEITDAVQRVGSVAKAANISAESTAALATAMIASGANAEVAATGTKNFIRALGAGQAATKRQREAFTALGLSAEETAAYLSKGGKEAEQVIKGVVDRIGMLRQEDRLPVLIELFGSESIGAIGPLATNIELLGKAFDIAGDATKAAGSVQKEYETRSKTTAQAVARAKAALQVFAIQLGEHLLPYIRQVADFLSSPEGQEWGKRAIEGGVDAVKRMVGVGREVLPVLLEVAKAALSIAESLGGAGTAALLAVPKILGLATALSGPVGLAVAAAAAGAALGAMATQTLLDNLDAANQRFEQMRENGRGVAESFAAGLKPLDAFNRALIVQAESLDASRRAYARLMLQLSGDSKALAEFDRREDATRVGREKYAAERDRQYIAKKTREAEGRRTEDARRADSLRRRGSGSADTVEVIDVIGLGQAKAEIKAAKEAARKGRSHKATKMDRQLAALDPALAGVLTQGGALDRGGDAKVSGDVLSRGVFAAANRGPGGLGGVSSDRGSVGPGPNITNTTIFNQLTVNQQIDARGSAPAPDNLRGAADRVADRVAGVTFTGGARVKASRNAGGRLTPA